MFSILDHPENPKQQEGFLDFIANSYLLIASIFINYIVINLKNLSMYLGRLNLLNNLC